MGNRVMKIVKPQTSGTAHGQEDWAYTIYSRDATGNVIAVYDRRWESLMEWGKPDIDIAVQVPPGTPRPGSGVIGVKVDGEYITAGPVLGGSTPEATATAFANAVNAYTGGTREFTAETDGDIVYLFTESSYENPLNFEVLLDDPEFEHNEYFDFVPLKRIGTRPHSGSFTKLPLIETVTLSELHIYGSSRLGIKTPDLEISQRQINTAYTSNYGNSLYLNVLDSRDIVLTNPVEGPFFEHNKGLKQYELSNHLGNVLVVFEDKKVSHEGSSGEVGHYTASLLNVQDYYPGGWMQPGRKYSNSNHYRYKHQGQEADDEIYGEGDAYNYTFRINDTRTNRFWSVDPLAVKYPFYSTYAFSGNRLIDAVELEGAEPAVVNEDIKNPAVYEGRDGGLYDPGTPIGNEAVQAPASCDDPIVPMVSGTSMQMPAQASLNPVSSSLMDDWSRSEGFIGQTTYGLANGLWLFGQVNPVSSVFIKNPSHLGGGLPVTQSQKEGGFVDGTATLLPFAGMAAKTMGYSLKTISAGNSAVNASTKLPTQIHHFATNKHSVWTSKMGNIAKQYGLDLSGAWNKAAMPHLGRHPEVYHKFVFQNMQRAATEAGGNSAKFLQLFDQYVKQPVLQNPNLLRKSGW